MGTYKKFHNACYVGLRTNYVGYFDVFNLAWKSRTPKTVLSWGHWLPKFWFWMSIKTSPSLHRWPSRLLEDFWRMLLYSLFSQSIILTTSISTTLITTIIYNLTNLLTNSPVYLVIEQNVKSPRQMFFALTCWNYHRLLAAVVLFDLMLLFVSNNFSPSSQFSHHCTSDKN